MKFHYFAYGSNMLPARLKSRCRSAELKSIGVAPGFSLAFSKPSMDGSGKATLVRDKGGRVPEVIFEIEVSDREELDRHEGLGNGYRRCDTFEVQGVAPCDICVTSTYLATSWDTQLKPYDWYLATVIAGASHHEMDEMHIAALKNTIFIEDIVKDRKTRIIAIESLLSHGIKDFRTLLESPR